MKSKVKAKQDNFGVGSQPLDGSNNDIGGDNLKSKKDKANLSLMHRLAAG